MPLTVDAAILKFAKAIEPYSEGELAVAGKATKDAAKSWKRGDAMPRSVPLLNMAMTLPEVWRFILEVRGDAHPESPKSANELLREALRQMEARQ